MPWHAGPAEHMTACTACESWQVQIKFVLGAAEAHWTHSGTTGRTEVQQQYTCTASVLGCKQKIAQEAHHFRLDYMGLIHHHYVACLLQQLGDAGQLFPSSWQLCGAGLAS